MNKIFFIMYLTIIGILLALFFIGPNILLNKFIVLGAIVAAFLIAALFFDVHIYDKMEHIQKLKIEKGFKLISAKLFVYIGAIILALFFFFWLINSGHLNKYLGEEPNTNLNGDKITCSDPDKEDYLIKGTTQLTVSGIGMPKEADSCIDTQTLKEKICESGKIVDKIIACSTIIPSSKCVDGRCFAQPIGNITQNTTPNTTITINQNNQTTLNFSELVILINLSIDENDTELWNSTDYLDKETEMYVKIRINPSGPPIISNLQARPDSFSDTGMVDDDTKIFITWDLIATYDTKCYGGFGDKSSMREIGIDGLDVAPALKGWNTFYMRCCNKNACDYEQASMKVELP